MPAGFRVFGILATAAVCWLPSMASACPAPPPAVQSLDLQRYYTDAEGTVADPELLAAKRAATEPLTVFLREVTANADKALRRGASEAGKLSGSCAAEWLAAWAASGAWLGRMESKQAEYQRKWDFAGVALAYLKVKSYATATQRAAIEPWLIQLADAARAFFDDPGRKRNNHWYWLAPGLAATALTTGSERHWAMAREIAEDAARDIRTDGALPLELDRKPLALKYHAFSLMPLVVAAELAAARGEDWYALGDRALHRLAALTMRGLADPKQFADLVGVAQEIPVNPGAGWAGLYAKRFPGRMPAGLPAIPQGHRWIGGDADLLAVALSRLSDGPRRP